MPLGRKGLEVAASALAGVSPADTLYVGLLTDNSAPTSRSEEANAAGYARGVITFTAGNAPAFVAQQGDDVEITFTANESAIRGMFISTTQTDASDTAFQNNIVGYVLGYNLSGIGNGTTVTISNTTLSVSAL